MWQFGEIVSLYNLVGCTTPKFTSSILVVPEIAIDRHYSNIKKISDRHPGFSSAFGTKVYEMFAIYPRYQKGGIYKVPYIFRRERVRESWESLNQV